MHRVLAACLVVLAALGAAADGGEGRSLFYYLPVSATWQQVWVTARATARGGVKEKRLEVSTDEGVTWRAVFDSVYVRPGRPPAPSDP